MEMKESIKCDSIISSFMMNSMGALVAFCAEIVVVFLGELEEFIDIVRIFEFVLM